MKNKRLFWMVILLVNVLASCGNKTENGMKVNVIFDNPAPHAMPLVLFGDVSQVLVDELDIADGIPSSVSVFLVEEDGKQLLFDSGNGNEKSQLIAELEKLGIAPQDIDYIFVTHMHGDHIGGLTKEGQKVFMNAQIYISATEADAWAGQANADAVLKAYEGNVVKFVEGDVLPCGVEAIAAYGHTPGHTVYRVGDALIVGDIMHGVALQMDHPEYCARFDMNHEHAIASRKAIIGKVKKEGWKMYGMHFPSAEPIVLK